jgi:predicted Zn-dependent peptidase
VGDLPVAQVEQAFQRYFNVKATKRLAKRKPASLYKPMQKQLLRPVKQAKCAIGRPAYPIHHPDRIPFFLLVNMLGGPGMNSRLNMALREKHGYVYSIEAHYMSYSDTGMFAVFFGTKPSKLDRCMELVQRELDKFCDKPLTIRQLNAAKEQLKGQLAMAEENNQSLMMMMGRSMLDLNRVPSLEEIFAIIEGVSATDINRVAREMFNAKGLSYLTMVPN